MVTYELQLWGLPRSGLHITALWLISNLQGSIYSLGRQMNASWKPRMVGRTTIRRVGDQPHTCFIYEAFARQYPDTVRSHDPIYVHAPIVRPMVLMRSIYNLVASKLEMVAQHEAEFAAPWEEGDREAWLEFPQLGIPVILYDQFITDPEYRRQLEVELDILGDDGVLRTIPDVGHGSSFTGLVYDGFADSEKFKYAVLNRWREVKMPDWLLQDDELRHTNFELFGWTLDKEGNYVT